MMNKIHDEALEIVNGGTKEQANELKAFIRQHDPSYRIDNVCDTLAWLQLKSGIKFSSISYCEDEPNIYT